MQRYNKKNQILFITVLLINFLPLIKMFLDTFIHENRISIYWYMLLFKNRLILASLFNSLILAVASSLFSTLIATLSVLCIYYFKKTKNFFLYHSIVYVLLPDIAIGFALLIFFHFYDFGSLNLILGHTILSATYLTFLLASHINDIDQSVHEAAKDLKISKYKIFTKILLPILTEPLYMSFFLALAISFDDVIVSSLIAKPSETTFPCLVYSAARHGISKEINAGIILSFLISGILGFLSFLVMKSKVQNAK